MGLRTWECTEFIPNRMSDQREREPPVARGSANWDPAQRVRGLPTERCALGEWANDHEPGTRSAVATIIGALA